MLSSPLGIFKARVGTVRLNAMASIWCLTFTSSTGSFFFFLSFFGIKPSTCKWLLQYLRSSDLGMGLVQRWLLYLATYSHCLKGAVLSSRTCLIQKA